MPDPANSKTRATAAIAASVLTATGAGNASAASLVQNTGGPSSNAQQSRMQRTSKQAHPTLRIEQGSAINTTRSQTITVSGNGSWVNLWRSTVWRCTLANTTITP